MKKQKKDTSTSKKVAAAKRRKRPLAKNSPSMLAPGEEIRLSLRTRNQFSGYDPRLLREEGPSRPIEGIILSIREIASGQLVPLASSNFGGYVLEILHNRSFNPSCASTQNAPSSMAGNRVQASPLWAKVRATLRAMTKERRLVSLTDGSLSSSPLASLLDGWRVVKVKADQIDTPE